MARKHDEKARTEKRAGSVPRTDLPPKREPYYEGYFGTGEEQGAERERESGEAERKEGERKAGGEEAEEERNLAEEAAGGDREIV